MAGYQIIRIDVLEGCDDLPNVLVGQWRHDVESTDHRMHFLDAGSGCIEARRIDVQYRHVVEQRLRLVAEIDQNIARLVAAPGLRMHGQSPLGAQLSVSLSRLSRFSSLYPSCHGLCPYSLNESPPPPL